ncbi:unnamed protein product [Arctogadus glacialis]
MLFVPLALSAGPGGTSSWSLDPWGSTPSSGLGCLGAAPPAAPGVQGPLVSGQITQRRLCSRRMEGSYWEAVGLQGRHTVRGVMVGRGRVGEGQRACPPPRVPWSSELRVVSAATVGMETSVFLLRHMSMGDCPQLMMDVDVTVNRLKPYTDRGSLCLEVLHGPDRGSLCLEVLHGPDRGSLCLEVLHGPERGSLCLEVLHGPDRGSLCLEVLHGPDRGSLCLEVLHGPERGSLCLEVLHGPDRGSVSRGP